MIKLIQFTVIFLLMSCAPGGQHKPFSGMDDHPLGDGSSVGYESVKPIFAKYCAACHPSRSGPDWLDFNQATVLAKNGKLLRRIAQERSMPPPGSPQAAALSETERLTIAAWAKSGGPQTVSSTNKPIEPEEASSVPKVAQNCLHCHGASGSDSSAEPRFPVLVGQNEAYLINQLTRFKWRDRIDPSQAMNDVAIGLSGEQIVEAAHYFATRKNYPGPGESSLSGLNLTHYQRGKILAERDCVSCHSNVDNHYRPSSPYLPVLVGQSKIYLMNQLIYFRGRWPNQTGSAIRVGADERVNPLMRELAQELTNEDIEALAVYFANVRFEVQEPHKR